MVENAAPGRDSVQVLRRSARILDCFTTATPHLRAQGIHRATGLPTSTVGRIIGTLVEEDLLQRQGDYYSIGLRVTGWSAAANAGSDLLAAAAPTVRALRDQSGETAGIYVRNGSHRVVVLQEQSTRDIIYRAHVGQVLPLHAGAAGKVFMAYDPRALDAAVDAGLTQYTPGTTTVETALRGELQDVRARGWAFTQEERELGLNSVAAPVFGPGGALIASLAIGGPAFRLTPTAAEHFGGLVSEAAVAISRALLWHGEAASSRRTSGNDRQESPDA